MVRRDPAPSTVKKRRKNPEKNRWQRGFHFLEICVFCVCTNANSRRSAELYWVVSAGFGNGGVAQYSLRGDGPLFWVSGAWVFTVLVKSQKPASHELTGVALLANYFA